MTFKVLVTGASTPAGRSMIHALQCEPVTLLTCDAEECGCAVDGIPPTCSFAIRSTGNPELIGDLLSLCVRHDVDVIVPMHETEQVALGREQRVFEHFGTRVWLAPIPSHVTRSLARRVVQFGRRRKVASTVGDFWRRLNGERAVA